MMMRISMFPFVLPKYRLLAMVMFSASCGDEALSGAVSVLSCASREEWRMGVVVWVRLVGLAVALTVATSGFARADGDGDHDGDRRHEEAERASRGADSGELVPLASIVATVRDKYPGEIVATEFESEGERPYYEFHLLDEDGRLTEVKVDARNGRILGREPDDD
jgi:uncharacterized membrane protein YkoI